MNKMVNNIQQNWKRIVSVVMVLVLVVTSVNMEWNAKEAKAALEDYYIINQSGDIFHHEEEMQLRRAQDKVQIMGHQTGDTYKWTVLGDDIIQVIPDSEGSRSATIKANSVDDIDKAAVVVVTITHGDGTSEDFRLTVRVTFSISENLDINGYSWEWIHSEEEDARRALVIDYGAPALQLGSSDADDLGKKLNLVFGDANSARWRSDNENVVQVNDSSEQKLIVAAGAGHTTLRVEYTVGTETYTDNVEVYVRPQVTLGDKIVAGYGAEGNGVIPEGNIDDGDSLGVSVAFNYDDAHRNESISDKLTWVISKRTSSGSVLLKDSLGNGDSKDVSLEWNQTNGQYTLHARAGEYIIEFYVEGTYTSFDQAKANPSGCQPVSIEVRILAKYTDKEVTVNIGGSYDLSKAFNIPADVLAEYFDIQINEAESRNTIEYADATRVVINAKNLGIGYVTVTAKDNVDIPGVRAGQVVNIIIHVGEAFHLSQSYVEMAVGSTLTLFGEGGSGSTDINFSSEEDFTWVWDSSYLSLDKNKQYATITALKEGETIVTLIWQDREGINHTASCRVIIRRTVSGLQINPATEILEAGGITKILDTGLSGTHNFQWISSNTSRVTVTPLEGNTKATIAAPANATPGQAVITVINMDNGTFATCLVTVMAPITSIAIDKGTDYRTTMAEGIVQMRAIYQPSNATDTELIWTSSDESIATVDEYGRVTLLREGDVYISVRPAVNPNNVHADCFLHIVENPITQITPDVTELEMITGDTYEVSLNIVPENPSDWTIQWSSSDERVATVRGGVITAVSAGEAVITISGGKVGRPVSEGEDYIPPAQIKVKVRNRIQKIEFGQKVMYVPLGGTRELTVIFTPDVDINDTLIWNSSDTSVVTVSDEGILTGISIGTAMITCYAEDMGPENMISCMIYVTDQTIIPAAGLTLLPEESTLEVGQTLQMDAVFDPIDTTNQYIQWSSSDTKIATITPEGLVTAVEVGEVTITAIYTDTPDGEPWILYSKITVIPATVEATGFDITPDSMNIKVKERFTITPVFTPADTTDKTVEYQTTDESVATVSEDGVVTGVGAGDCIIQAQANSGGFIATCAVHVENAIGFSLSPSYREIAVGKSFTIKKVTVPANADKTAVWTSSNTKIATVNSSGKVTAKKIGTCTITCTLTEYNQRATCRVKVAKLNSTVTLDKKNIRIGVGSTYRLKATVWSNNSTTPSVKWKSSNKKVASVTSKGKVKGKRIGVAKITVTTKDKVKAKATCRVTVIRRATSIKINKRYAICYVGRTMKLKASVRPKTATIKKIKWSSSDKNIAVVNGAGKVTGMSEGDVTITAKATDGSGKKATCLVKVLEEVPATSVVVAQSNLTMKKGDSTKLTYSVLPKNNSDHLSFASDNKRVAKVDSNGKVRAIGTGTANITILAGSGVTTTVVVNVVDLNKHVVNMRQYDTETLRVLGTASNVTWYSSNNRVATVDGGVVTGRRIGSTYIYAYVGGCKLACRVTITSVNK